MAEVLTLRARTTAGWCAGARPCHPGGGRDPVRWSGSGPRVGCRGSRRPAGWRRLRD